MKLAPKKKKKLYNILMIAVICVIALSCVMIAGNLKGWFDDSPSAVSGSSAVAAATQIRTAEKSGTVSVERSGVAYSLEDDNVLRDGDKISTRNGASIDLVFADSVITLEENSEVTLSVSGEDGPSFALESGSLIADLSDSCRVNLADTDASAEDAVLICSAPYGSGNVYVLAGTPQVADRAVEAGTEALISDSGTETSGFSADLLNDFELEKLEEIIKTRALCFSADDIANAIAQRKSEVQSALEESLNGSSGDNGSDSADSSSAADDSGTADADGSGDVQESDSDGSGSGDSGNGSTGSGGSQESGSGNDSGSSGQTKMSCTVEIRCDTILSHMSDLEDGKSQYVPSDGTILAATKVSFEEGDTALDVLKKVCDAAGIQMESSWSPGYGSSYVEGIGNLYEFDCGDQSGWIYKVNGWSPNYGASSYQVKDGDVIGWYYTCSGYGSDV